MEFEFMTADTVLPPCMPLPTAMLRLPVSSTAKVMYARLLDATLAGGAEDTNGILFVRFPIEQLPSYQFGKMPVSECPSHHRPSALPALSGNFPALPLWYRAGASVPSG